MVYREVGRKSKSIDASDSDFKPEVKKLRENEKKQENLNSSDIDNDLKLGRTAESKRKSLLPHSLEINEQTGVAAVTSSPTKSNKRRSCNITEDLAILPKTKKEYDYTRTIFVSNLPLDVNGENIRKVFVKYGEIESVFVARSKSTGTGKGYAYVIFKTSESKESSLSAENIELDGQSLLVKGAESRSTAKTDSNRKNGCEIECDDTRTVYIGNLPSDVKDEDIQKIFLKFGEIESMKVLRNTMTDPRKGLAFVNFKTADSKESSLSADDLEINGQNLAVKNGLDSNCSAAEGLATVPNNNNKYEKRDNTRKISVTNLPFDIKRSDIRKAFASRFGKVEEVVIIPKGKINIFGTKRAFVIFKNIESKLQSLSAKKPIEINGKIVEVHNAEDCPRTAKIKFGIRSNSDTTPWLATLPNTERVCDDATICITQLPFDIKEDDLKNAISIYGEIENLQVSRDMLTKEAKAFLTFKNEELKESSLVGIEEPLVGSEDPVLKTEDHLLGNKEPGRKFADKDVKTEDVQNAFLECGEVGKVQVTSQAYITFKDVESKKSCLSADGIEINGKKIKVVGKVSNYTDFSRSKRKRDVKNLRGKGEKIGPKKNYDIARRIVIKNLPPAVETEEILNLFQKFGEIDDVRVLFYGERKPFAFLNFKTAESKQKSLLADNLEICGQILKVA